MRGRPNSGMMLIFTIGFCAIPAQVILMRELLMVFGGNELFIGLFLAVWMLLTAAGSYMAGFLRLKEAHIPFYRTCSHSPSFDIAFPSRFNTEISFLSQV